VWDGRFGHYNSSAFADSGLSTDRRPKSGAGPCSSKSNCHQTSRSIGLCLPDSHITEIFF
jgi:hypothetical protein